MGPIMKPKSPKRPIPPSVPKNINSSCNCVSRPIRMGGEYCQSGQPQCCRQQNSERLRVMAHESQGDGCRNPDQRGAEHRHNAEHRHHGSPEESAFNSCDMERQTGKRALHHTHNHGSFDCSSCDGEKLVEQTLLVGVRQWQIVQYGFQERTAVTKEKTRYREK